MSGSAPSESVVVSRLQLAEPQVVADIVDGEVLAIDLGSGAYHHLTDWSAYVWSLLIAGWSIDESENLLRAAVPGVEPGVVERFAAQLIELRLVVARSIPPVETDPPEVPGTPFAGLSVQSFDDMAELILLDPVHEVDPNAGWPQRPDR